MGIQLIEVAIGIYEGIGSAVATPHQFTCSSAYPIPETWGV